MRFAGGTNSLDEDGFSVVRYIDYGSYGIGKTIAWLPADTVELTDSELVRGVSYYYVASLWNSLGASPDSNKAFAPDVPDRVASLKLTPRSVRGGRSARGTVRLTSVAPAEGAVITLTGGTTAVVPASIRIRPGGRSGSFVIKTDGARQPQRVRITARYGDSRKAARLRVLPLYPVSRSHAHFGIIDRSMPRKRGLAGAGRSTANPRVCIRS